MKVKRLKDVLDQFFPESLAESWDSVGLQIGSLNSEIKGIMLTLDMTLEVIQEALDKEVNIIIVHHPIIFRPLKEIRTDSYLGQMIEALLTHRITVIAAHTNFDISNFGTNQILADQIGLDRRSVIEQMTENEGLGVVGQLEKEQSFDDFVQHLKQVFELEHVRVVGPEPKSVMNVAVCGGSCADLIPQLIDRDVDVFVTGDVSYHHALDAKNSGLTVVDVGHNVEKFILDPFAKFLRQNGIDAPIFVSENNTDPYRIK